MAAQRHPISDARLPVSPRPTGGGSLCAWTPPPRPAPRLFQTTPHIQALRAPSEDRRARPCLQMIAHPPRSSCQSPRQWPPVVPFVSKLSLDRFHLSSWPPSPQRLGSVQVACRRAAVARRLVISCDPSRFSFCEESFRMSVVIATTTADSRSLHGLPISA